MIGAAQDMQIGKDRFRTTGNVEITGCGSDAKHEPMRGTVSAAITVTVATKAFAKGLKRARSRLMQFYFDLASVKWKHARSRGENQRGRFRGIPRMRGRKSGSARH